MLDLVLLDFNEDPAALSTMDSSVPDDDDSEEDSKSTLDLRFPLGVECDFGDSLLSANLDCDRVESSLNDCEKPDPCLIDCVRAGSSLLDCERTGSPVRLAAPECISSSKGYGCERK